MTRVASDMDGVFVDSERYWFERGRQEIFPVCVAGDVDPEAVTGMNVEDRYDHLDCEFGTTVSKAPFADRYDRVANETYDERVALLEESEPPAKRSASAGPTWRWSPPRPSAESTACSTGSTSGRRSTRW
jgi:beta-phosphoglucomutase-like phosphatase (HAD superfamily)